MTIKTSTFWLAVHEKVSLKIPEFSRDLDAVASEGLFGYKNINNSYYISHLFTIFLLFSAKEMEGS